MWHSQVFEIILFNFKAFEEVRFISFIRTDVNDVEENQTKNDITNSEDIKKLQEILRKGENVNSQDSYGYTELHRAAKFGNNTLKCEMFE